MCGILGICNTQKQPIDLGSLLTSTRTIRHRGPDDEGYLLVNLARGITVPCGGEETDPRLGLPGVESCLGQPFDFAFGFRRLSILDLSPGGHQPMSSPDGRYWIIFNGEIYNYIELRAELTNLGYEFLSTADTEVLLAGYTHWGVEMLPKLVGMFAFAILDVQMRKLFLARDFFGIKPLYYVLNDHRFAFASEAKALIALGDVSRRINPDALYMYLRYGLTDQDSGTLWNEIRHLPAAHYLEVSLDAQRPVVHPTRYWQIDMSTRLSLSASEAAEQLRHLFLENIRFHLRSDVPVGAALSGGIDSSSIVSAMRYHQGHQKIHTFSYVADDPKVNEESWIDLVGQHAQTIAHKTRIDTTDLISDLDEFIFSLDEPVSTTSMYAQFCVFRLAQECGIKVMLDGQGADELLGGYSYFFSGRLVSLIRRHHWNEAARFLRNTWQRPYFGGPRLIYRAGGWLLPENLHGLARKAIGEDLVPDWLNSDWFKKNGMPAQSMYIWDHTKDIFHTLLYQSVTQTSLPMLLRYEDRNSMAHSVESRVPFLTPALVNFIFSLPEEHIVDVNGTTKAVFRRAMHDIVPSSVLQRQDKLGFSTPERQWLNDLSPWVEATLNSQIVDSIPALNRTKISGEWRNVLTGRKPFNFRIWRWINLIRWVERYQIEF